MSLSIYYFLTFLAFLEDLDVVLRLLLDVSTKRQHDVLELFIKISIESGIPSSLQSNPRGIFRWLSASVISLYSVLCSELAIPLVMILWRKLCLVMASPSPISYSVLKDFNALNLSSYNFIHYYNKKGGQVYHDLPTLTKTPKEKRFCFARKLLTDFHNKLWLKKNIPIVRRSIYTNTNLIYNVSRSSRR